MEATVNLSVPPKTTISPLKLDQRSNKSYNGLTISSGSYSRPYAEFYYTNLSLYVRYLSRFVPSTIAIRSQSWWKCLLRSTFQPTSLLAYFARHLLSHLVIWYRHGIWTQLRTLWLHWENSNALQPIHSISIFYVRISSFHIQCPTFK